MIRKHSDLAVHVAGAARRQRGVAAWLVCSQRHTYNVNSFETLYLQFEMCHGYAHLNKFLHIRPLSSAHTPLALAPRRPLPTPGGAVVAWPRVTHATPVTFTSL